MKSIEALFSLVVLTLFSVVVLSIHSIPQISDVYKVQLADDIWHIVLLKYNGIPSFASPEHVKLESDLNIIGSKTGFCIYLGGIRTTNCRGVKGTNVVSIHRNYLDTSTGVPVLKDITITLKKQD